MYKSKDTTYCQSFKRIYVFRNVNLNLKGGQPIRSPDAVQFGGYNTKGCIIQLIKQNEIFLETWEAFTGFRKRLLNALSILMS